MKSYKKYGPDSDYMYNIDKKVQLYTFTDNENTLNATKINSDKLSSNGIDISAKDTTEHTPSSNVQKVSNTKDDQNNLTSNKNP